MNTTAEAAQVLAVNVGTPRVIEWLGQTATTAIWKAPIAGRVAVQGVNLAGDDQADRTVHGGPDKAIYVYAADDTAWWEQTLGRALGPGAFGENLTLAGVRVTAAVIGERWAIGSTVLEVAQPRVPCWKLGARMGDPAFPPRFAAAGRPGAYLRIVEPGDVGAGDAVRVVHRPAHGLTVGDVARIYHQDRAEAAAFLRAPELAVGWQHWAENQLRHAAATRRSGA